MLIVDVPTERDGHHWVLGVIALNDRQVLVIDSLIG